jgi:phosphatidate cytidylyltransferase
MAPENASAAADTLADLGGRNRSAAEWLKSVAQRARTAFILMPIIIVLAWFGGWWAFACALVFTVVALWELRRMLAQRGLHPIMTLSGALCIVFLVAAELPQQRLALVALGISGMLVGSFAWLMISRQASLAGSLTDWALTMVLPFYLGWPLAVFLLLRGPTLGYHVNGFWWMLATLFGVWGFDTAAFFAGRWFGHHQMAPLISPKKTWEGAAGGLIFALIGVFVCTLPIGVAWYHVLAIGVLVSVAATLGDLAESLLKRDVGVKDSGTIMPGHGGILDRIDSLLFAILVVFFYAAFLGSIKV